MNFEKKILTLTSPGLLISRSFVLEDNCRHCITVFDGRFSSGLGFDPVDEDLGDDKVLGNDLALVL